MTLSGSRHPHLRLGPLALILPSALATGVVILVPLLQLSRMALYHVSRFGRFGPFAGLENCAHLWADPLFIGAAERTAVWIILVIGGTLGASMPVALILHRPFVGRGLAQLIILLPWAVSLTSTAIVWRRALNGETGLFNTLLRLLGVTDHPIAWLGSAPVAFAVEILVGILVSIPFCVAIFLSGLSTLPHDIYDAARMDGAGAWQRFRLLTLPLMRPFITIASIFNLAYVSNSFPIIWVLTQGGPAGGTDILITYLYKLAFVFGRLGDAAALSLMMCAALLVVTVALLRLALGAQSYA